MATQPNLSKLALYTPIPGFKNNKKYSGSFTINAPLNGPITFQDHFIYLDQAPDLLQIEFQGPTNNTFSPPIYQRQPNDWVDAGDYDFFTAESYDPYWGGFVPAPVDFLLLTEVFGNRVNVRSAMPKQYQQDVSYNPIVINYRITDYSVF